MSDVLRVLGVVVLVVVGCDKPSAPVAAPEPSAAPVGSVMPAVPASSVAAPVTAASTTAGGSGGDAGGSPGAAAAGRTKDGGGALKAASRHVDGKNYGIDLTSPGCRAGDECAVTIKLTVAGDYHVNKEYPYKFLATSAPNLTYLGKTEPNTFTRSAGDFVAQGEKVGTMTVRFKSATAGDAKIAGKYKLSVCSADQCLIEEEMLELAVSVH